MTFYDFRDLPQAEGRGDFSVDYSTLAPGESAVHKIFLGINQVETITFTRSSDGSLTTTCSSPALRPALEGERLIGVEVTEEER